MAAISSWGMLRKSLQRRRVEEQVRRLRSAPPISSATSRRLSGGNQQKVVLAKWLLTAEMLILDEPTRGVDIAAKRDIYELIGHLANSGIAIL